MKAAAVHIHIFAMCGMKLNNPIFRLPEQIFYLAHDRPLRRSFVSLDADADVLPSLSLLNGSIARNAAYGLTIKTKSKQSVESKTGIGDVF